MSSDSLHEPLNYIRLPTHSNHYVTIPLPIKISLTKLYPFFAKHPKQTFDAFSSLMHSNNKTEAINLLNHSLLDPNSSCSVAQTHAQSILSLINNSSVITTPKTALENTILGHHHLQQHKPDARKYFSKAAEMNTQYAPAYVGMAIIEAKEKSFKTALSLLKKAAALQPTNPSIRNGIAFIHHNLGNTKLAFRTYESVLALDPTDRIALVNLSRIYWNYRTPETVNRAIFCASQALKYWNDPYAALVLAEAGFLAESPETEKLANFALVVEKKHFESKPTERNPNDSSLIAHAHFILGKIAHKKDDYEAALKEYNNAVKADPTLAVARYRAAQICVHYKKYKEAIDFLSPIQTTDFEVTKLLGICYFLSNNPSEARKQLEFASKQQKDATVELVLASLKDDNNYDEAIIHYKNSGNSRGEVLNNIGSCYYFLKQYEQALEYYQQCSHSPTNLFNTARTLEAMGKWTEASEKYNKIIEDYPWYYDASIRLAYHYWELRDYETASNYITQALKVSPHQGDLLVILGQLHMDIGDLSTAQAIFDRATKEDRGNIYSFIALANVYYKYGKKNLKFLNYAIELYTKVLKHDNGNILALHGLAVISYEMRQVNFSLEAFGRISSLSQSSDTLFSLASVNFYAKKYAVALKIFRDALQKFGQTHDISTAIAQTALFLKRYSDALLAAYEAYNLRPCASSAINYIIVADATLGMALKKVQSDIDIDGIMKRTEEMVQKFEGDKQIKEIGPHFTKYWKEEIEKWKKNKELDIKRRNELQNAQIERAKKEQEKQEEEKAKKLLKLEKEKKEQFEKIEKEKEKASLNKASNDDSIDKKKKVVKDISVKKRSSSTSKRKFKDNVVEEEDDDDDVAVTPSRVRRNTRSTRSKKIKKMSVDDDDDDDDNDNDSSSDNDSSDHQPKKRSSSKKRSNTKDMSVDEGGSEDYVRLK
ncbi:tpr repeat nuclear phosphoprotein/ctr9 [Entamoeba marina]